jgi:diguanylate cyclase (GGDEF)-like protein
VGDDDEAVELGTPTRGWRRTVLPSALVLAAAVAVLSTVSLLVLDRISESSRTVATSSRVLASYQVLQRAIATEAFAEAGYRRAPTDAARDRLLASFSVVDDAARAVASSGRGSDRAAALYLLVLNTRYADQVRDAVARPGAAPATTGDDFVAGPALDAMQRLVDAAIRRTSEESSAALAEQERLTDHLRWLTPVVLSGVVAALGLSWVLVLRQHRRATARAERSEHLALHDALTGASNRRAFERALAHELGKGAPDATLFLLDLDGFKAINDTYGHDVGDEVLRVVARRLRAVLRPSDVVARLGGDEFGLLVRPRDPSGTTRERVRSAVTAPLHCSGTVLHPGVSVGSSCLRAGAVSDDVLHEADQALYHDKRARSGHVPRSRRAADQPLNRDKAGAETQA